MRLRVPLKLLFIPSALTLPLAIAGGAIDGPTGAMIALAVVLAVTLGLAIAYAVREGVREGKRRSSERHETGG